jgi:hypothetical protein
MGLVGDVLIFYPGFSFDYAQLPARGYQYLTPLGLGRKNEYILVPLAEANGNEKMGRL